jgi:hypothetical protein
VPEGLGSPKPRCGRCCSVPKDDLPTYPVSPEASETGVTGDHLPPHPTKPPVQWHMLWAAGNEASIRAWQGSWTRGPRWPSSPHRPHQAGLTPHVHALTSQAQHTRMALPSVLSVCDAHLDQVQIAHTQTECRIPDILLTFSFLRTPSDAPAPGLSELKFRV